MGGRTPVPSRMIILSSFALLALASGPALAGIGCVPTCQVASHTLAFVPPVTEVPSGGSVTWSALDTFHTASDADRDNVCFNALFVPNSPASASFLVLDGVLHAAADGDDLKPCLAAEATPDGSFVLDYVCYAHPNTMKGKIVVR